jgi:hypothetical protein
MEGGCLPSLIDILKINDVEVRIMKLCIFFYLLIIIKVASSGGLLLPTEGTSLHNPIISNLITIKYIVLFGHSISYTILSLLLMPALMYQTHYMLSKLIDWNTPISIRILLSCLGIGLWIIIISLAEICVAYLDC